MDARLQTIFRSLLNNIEVLNMEIQRMGRCELFHPSDASYQMIEEIRGQCFYSLQSLQALERALQRKRMAEAAEMEAAEAKHL